MFQQCPDVFFKYRMNDCGIYITNRLQDKASFVQAGVGYLKVRCVDHGLVVEDDIQVDDPGPEANSVTVATGPLLNSLKGVQQGVTIETGDDFSGRVHEPVLIQIVDRGGFVKPGAGDDGRMLKNSQGVDGPPAIIELVPQIGSDGDNDRMKVTLQDVRPFKRQYPAQSCGNIS
jgi:hypothetical protein